MGAMSLTARNGFLPMTTRKCLGHHMSDELIYVSPTKIVTIGPKSKLRVLENLQALHEKLEVISVFETAPKPIETEELTKQLSQEIATRLGATSTLQQGSPLSSETQQ